jgi:hypothetical protein
MMLCLVEQSYDAASSGAVMMLHLLEQSYDAASSGAVI